MPEATKDYSIERLNKVNLKDLDALFKAVYDRKPPVGFFFKKYDTEYTGAACLGYFAYNPQGVPIAYYGVMPCFIKYRDEILLSAQSGDTMTHPEYRNRGLFVELCKLTIDLCRKENVRLLFGFPNQRSYPGFINKLGWSETNRMECFCIPVKTIPLAAYSNRFPVLRNIYRAYMNALLKKYILPEKGIRNAAVDVDQGGLLRDEAYFNYKTYSPTLVIRIGKAKAWVRINKDLIIGDLGSDGQDLDRTLDGLKKIAAWLGIRHMYFHSSPGNPLHGSFTTRYPVKASFPVIFMDLGAGIPFERLIFTFADIDTF